MAFDLAEMLKNVSDSDTGRKQITYLPLASLDADTGNFYGLRDVEQLADNIATVGLQQPILVRRNPDSPDRYRVVSGHRRRAALELLAKDDPERWSELPCIVEADAASPALQQLRLIYANANTRVMTSAEIGEQAAQVEKLLYQLQEEGYEFPGRMRDHVAQAVNVSRTKLARLKVIREGLEPSWADLYKENKITETTAYELARRSQTEQNSIWLGLSHANRLGLHSETVTTYAERFDLINEFTCQKDGGSPCTNQENMRMKSVAAGRWAGTTCRGCCDKCYDLCSCKFACPRLSQKIARLKKEKRDSEAEKQAARENKEKPEIDKIKAIWARLRDAMDQSGMDFDALWDAMDLNTSYLKRNSYTRDMLDGNAEKVTAYSSLPYGYAVTLSSFRPIIAAADALGCSVDYLLLRTDQPTPGASPDGAAGSGWHTGTPDTPGEYVAMTDWGRGHKSPERLRWTQEGWSKNGFVLRDVMPEVNVKAWIEEPTIAPPNNSCVTGMSPSPDRCAAAACCGQNVDCCLQCDEDCNVRCEWIDTDPEPEN